MDDELDPFCSRQTHLEHAACRVRSNDHREVIELEDILTLRHKALDFSSGSTAASQACQLLPSDGVAESPR